jgi:hypothetical protein
MRVRHKVPSIFSLSMVDMLCCALGCVILLWLLNARQHAEEVEDQARASAGALDEARAERDQVQRLLRGITTERDRKSQQLADALAERTTAEGLRRELQRQIRALEAARSALASQLASSQKAARGLEVKLKSSSARVADLERDVRAGDDRLAGVRKELDAERARSRSESMRLKELSRKVQGAESALKELRGDLTMARARQKQEQDRALAMEKEAKRYQDELNRMGRSLADLRAARDKLEKALAARTKELASARTWKDRSEAAEEREKYLEKQLRQRQTAMNAANSALQALRAQTSRLRAAGEAKFAGIALTGKRVIFLVDISGSMEMLDANTPAPQKWKSVRDTVVKLMRSLPDLEQYQVIAFAREVSYPLGSAGGWLRHDPRTSADRAEEALGKLKPKGGTNMYSALEAAFRYRSQGLDTIYLLSDGLPNLGEGLITAQQRELRGMARGLVLGKHVRQTLKRKWNATDPKQAKVKIHTIGFFYESPDLGSFLWALARENDGSFVGMSTP